MQKENMFTEDDTFRMLKRIPFLEMEKISVDPVLHPVMHIVGVSYNQWIKVRDKLLEDNGWNWDDFSYEYAKRISDE